MCQIWVHPKAEGIDDLIWNVNKESSLILPMQWSPHSILILIQFCAALNIFLLEPTYLYDLWTIVQWTKPSLLSFQKKFIH
jgi:hypothetical protein